MTSIPVASSFLAGSILSLLLPVLIFLALLVWYLKFIRRVPDTVDGSKAEAAGGAPADVAPPQSEH
jgi:hypothetical protein